MRREDTEESGVLPFGNTRAVGRPDEARGEHRRMRTSPSALAASTRQFRWQFASLRVLFFLEIDLPSLEFKVLFSQLFSLVSRLKKKSEKPASRIGSTQRHGCCRPVVPNGTTGHCDRTFVRRAGPGASWTTSIATGARVGSSGRTTDAIYTRAGPAHHRTQTSKPLARASMRTRYLEFTSQTRADKHTRSGSPRDGSEKWVSKKRMCEMFKNAPQRCASSEPRGLSRSPRAG